MGQDPANLIWIDLEMTGLDSDRDHIIEIATVVTDSELNVLAEGPELAIHQSDAVLGAMDAWNREHHGRSGLVDRVRESRCTVAEAEARTLAFLRPLVPEKTSPMCGNSVCQDRRFLYRHMPELCAFFHYRQLDVSTLKILAQRWAPRIAASVVKAGGHRALQDIHESIQELVFYRTHLWREAPAGPGAGQ